MGEVMVGFVFSDSIVHNRVAEPELPVVSSNKPELRLRPRTRTAQGRKHEVEVEALKLQDVSEVTKSHFIS